MPETTGPLAGRRILLVEDEFLIAELMEEWLSEAGADVLGPVPSVDQALEIVENELGRLDGAVLDINLGPGRKVYPVADRLNQLGIPYVFATGDIRVIDDPAHQERPRLEKPVSREHLLGALGKLL
jgi:CheY-like chemotaxis protein